MTHRCFGAFLPMIIVLTLGYIAFHAPSALSAPPAQSPVTTPTPITPKPGDRTYTVQANDSYWSIAQKMYGNGSKYNLILQANNLTEKSKLRVGAVLIIPGTAEAPVTVAPTGQLPVVAPVTPTPLPILQPTAQPTAVPTLPPISVVARPPPAATTPADPATARSAANVPSELRNQQLLTALDILSGIFAATSVICAFLAYQSYNRAKRFEKMVIVRRRARSHADLI